MLTSRQKVFAAGDSVSGASLVVNAIASGRKVAKEIDNFLMKRQSLIYTVKRAIALKIGINCSYEG